MNVRMKIAFGCYFLIGLLGAGIGIVYFFRTEFMSYHSVAVGLPWAEVPPNFQVLILALMKALGGTNITLALVLYVILFVPFRQGARWAIVAIPLIGLFQSAVMLYAMSHVALHTSAHPPFWTTGIGVLLIVVAFILSVSGAKPARAEI